MAWRSLWRGHTAGMTQSTGGIPAWAVSHHGASAPPHHTTPHFPPHHQLTLIQTQTHTRTGLLQFKNAKTGKVFKMSYPCAMLNVMVAEHNTNSQFAVRWHSLRFDGAPLPSAPLPPG